MLRRLLPLTLAVCLLAPATASAERYLTRSEAERATKQAAYNRYDIMRPVGAYCVLPGGREPDPDYAYKRWTCGWAAESGYSYEQCGGVLRILGARGWGSYRWSVIRGMRCD